LGDRSASVRVPTIFHHSAVPPGERQKASVMPEFDVRKAGGEYGSGRRPTGVPVSEPVTARRRLVRQLRCVRRAGRAARLTRSRTDER
jgi:hypothetical protein